MPSRRSLSLSLRRSARRRSCAGSHRSGPSSPGWTDTVLPQRRRETNNAHERTDGVSNTGDKSEWKKFHHLPACVLVLVRPEKNPQAFVTYDVWPGVSIFSQTPFCFFTRGVFFSPGGRFGGAFFSPGGRRFSPPVGGHRFSPHELRFSPL